MKHAYTQQELKQAVNEGRNIMVGYRSSASLCWSNGTQSIICMPHLRKVSGLPFTSQGRRMLVTPEHFHKLQMA